MNAEVALILEQKRSIMQGKGQQPKSDFLKAYTYVNQVKQFRDREVVGQVRQCARCSGRNRARLLLLRAARRGSRAHRAARSRRDLEKTGLDPFETAQLGNLCPQDASEARALIPSLDMQGRDIPDAQLTEILEQLNSFKQYPT